LARYHFSRKMRMKHRMATNSNLKKKKFTQIYYSFKRENTVSYTI